MIHNFNNWNRLYENKNNYNNKIDYTFLSDNATIDDIKQLCEDAIENNFYSICIKKNFVGTAKAFLDETDIKICSVISFPKGTDSTMNKVKEADESITDGADEIDMVMDYKKLKELSYNRDEEYKELYEELVDDIKQVARIVHKNGKLIKVIIEIEELNYNQIKIACDICEDAGTDFVKTSTGFASKMDSFDEKLEKIKYMRKILPEKIQIKASGGIRNSQQIEQVIPYVDRIGTSIIIEN